MILRLTNERIVRFGSHTKPRATRKTAPDLNLADEFMTHQVEKESVTTRWRKMKAISFCVGWYLKEEKCDSEYDCDGEYDCCSDVSKF